MTEHKEVCLIINGEQSVRLEKGIIDFKNCFKQIPVLFKVYADFECNLESAEGYIILPEWLTRRDYVNM